MRALSDKVRLLPELALLLAFGGCSDVTPTIDRNNERERGEVWAPPACAFDTAARDVVEAPEPVREASGLAIDPWIPDVFWTHNDSGDDAALYAFDRDGTLRHTLALVGVTALDWEALSIGPCRNTWCLYVGDIGDNLEVRRQIAVHRVPVPSLETGRSSATPETMQLVWPEGARNAEAMAVWPDETVVILSKETGTTSVGAHLFAATEDEPSTLEVLGGLSLAPWNRFGQVTGLDVTPDGQRALLRLYTHVVLIDGVGSPRDLATAAARTVTSPPELQGETVAWTPSGYVTLAEGRDAVLYEVGCE